MATLELRSLTKRYGSARGVENLNFAVEKGEIFGYLGPNGSGKTTTIRCAMGLLRPTSGEILVLGERVRSGRATAHARVAYLPGEFRIWPELSARRSLRALSALGGSGSAKGRCEELAERLELNLDRKARDLSKGNRQKIGVVFAFQHRPELLILDEPTSGLDPLMRQIVLDLIRESAAEGATVVLSSLISPVALALIVFATSMGLAYNLPIVPKRIARLIGIRRLRDLPMSKNLGTALAWCLMIVVLPILEVGRRADPLPTLMAFVFSFAVVFYILNRN